MLVQAQHADAAIAPALNAKRTFKCLYALARGAAVLTAAWVAGCADAGRLLPPSAGKRSGHVVHAPRPALRQRPLLSGARLLLSGSAKFRSTFGAVLAHAGALIIEEKEWEAGSAAGPSGAAPKAEKTQTGGQPAASRVADAVIDAIVLEDGEARSSGASGAAAGGASAGTGGGGDQVSRDLRRAARRLRIPVLKQEALVDALVKGELPPELAAMIDSAGEPFTGPSGAHAPAEPPAARVPAPTGIVKTSAAPAPPGGAACGKLASPDLPVAPPAAKRRRLSAALAGTPAAGAAPAGDAANAAAAAAPDAAGATGRGRPRRRASVATGHGEPAAAAAAAAAANVAGLADPAPAPGGGRRASLLGRRTSTGRTTGHEDGAGAAARATPSAAAAGRVGSGAAAAAPATPAVGAPGATAATPAVAVVIGAAAAAMPAAAAAATSAAPFATPVAASASAIGAAAPFAVEWVGSPLAPASASGAAMPHRQHYSGFRLPAGTVVHLGDCMELAPLPGEASTRIVKVEKLWAERAAAGKVRSVTTFPWIAPGLSRNII